MKEKTMQENNFKIGSVVKLTSGGPNMTVDDVRSYEGEQKILCVWFQHGKRYESVFKPATVTEVALVDPNLKHAADHRPAADYRPSEADLLKRVSARD
jgi:uncharacterized protein YodC (DUF2158 family)